MAENPSVSVSLLPLDSTGKTQSLTEPLDLYLSHPVVRVTKFEVRNLREEGKPGEERSYCDLEIVGDVTTWFLADPADDSPTWGKGELYVNGSDRPHRTFVLKRAKSAEANAASVHHGTFSLTVEKVPVTDGTNNFQLRVEDEVFGFYGESAWAAGFMFPYPLDPGEEPDPDAVKVPTITEAVHAFRGGGSGEGRLYVVAVNGLTAEQVSGALLHVGVDKVISGKLIRNPAGSGHLLAAESGDRPLVVGLRVTDRSAGFEPDDEAVIRFLATSPVAALSYRSAFLHGFAFGRIAGGVDLVASGKQQGVRAIELSLVQGAVILRGHLNLSDGTLIDLKSPVGPKIAELNPWSADKINTGELLAYAIQLKRSRDPLAEEFALALLTGDYADLGLKKLKVGDWHDNLYSQTAELCENAIDLSTSKPPQEAGYYLGRVIGEVLRLTSDPKLATRIDKRAKSEFLSDIKVAKFFGGSASAPHSLSQPPAKSAVDRLKKSLGF